MRRLFLALVFAVMLVEAAPAVFAAEGVLNQKILFPSQMDGFGLNPDFRFRPKTKGSEKIELLSLGERQYDPISALLIPPPALPAKKGNSFSKGLKLPYRLVLEARYNDPEDLTSKSLRESLGYSRIVETSSLGIAYPLTSRLTLNGRYGIVKGEDGIGPTMKELPASTIGATYKFNAATSISVSYAKGKNRKVNPLNQGKDNTTAELKIHF